MIMIIRDFYFAAWLIEQGYHYAIHKGILTINIDRLPYIRLKKDYEQVKPYYLRIKQIIKEINQSRRS
jgi:hypothetical protein